MQQTEPSYLYPGHELALFQNAVNWKNYFRKKISPYLRGEVLEVGAGIGATAKVLNEGKAKSWTLLELDEAMYQALEAGKDVFPINTRIIRGTLADLEQLYDTILYIDVLEHIEKDSEELERAASRLRDGGHLVVLSPAFQFLYSPFDKAIGHYRRYSKKDLQALTPTATKLVSIQYLDALGFFASVANKALLRQAYPTQKQVDFWDRHLVPFSKFLDPIFFHAFGKTVLALWQKT